MAKESYESMAKASRLEELKGLDELRQLLLRVKADPSVYERKVQRLLAYKHKETAQQMLDFEIDLLRRCLDEAIDGPNDTEIDEVLEKWLFDIANKKIEKGGANDEKKC